jgi:hypothetical protein
MFERGISFVLLLVSSSAMALDTTHCQPSRASRRRKPIPRDRSR